MEHATDVFMLAAQKTSDAIFSPSEASSNKRFLRAIDSDLTLTSRYNVRKTSLPEAKKVVFRSAARQLFEIKIDSQPDYPAERCARNKILEIAAALRPQT